MASKLQIHATVAGVASLCGKKARPGFGRPHASARSNDEVGVPVEKLAWFRSAMNGGGCCKQCAAFVAEMVAGGEFDRLVNPTPAQAREACEAARAMLAGRV